MIKPHIVTITKPQIKVEIKSTSPNVEIDSANKPSIFMVPSVPVKGDGVVSGGSAGQILSKKSNTNYDTEWVNHTEIDISGKADKVLDATNGHFAGLDANGNLTDSGSSASSFDAAGSAAQAESNANAYTDNITGAYGLGGRVDNLESSVSGIDERVTGLENAGFVTDNALDPFVKSGKYMGDWVVTNSYAQFDLVRDNNAIYKATQNLIPEFNPTPDMDNVNWSVVQNIEFTTPSVGEVYYIDWNDGAELWVNGVFTYTYNCDFIYPSDLYNNFAFGYCNNISNATEWYPETVYTWNDIVTVNGLFYVAIRGNFNGINIENTDYWRGLTDISNGITTTRNEYYYDSVTGDVAYCVIPSTTNYFYYGEVFAYTESSTYNSLICYSSGNVVNYDGQYYKALNDIPASLVYNTGDNYFWDKVCDLSDLSNYATNSNLSNGLNNKVDTVTGKGLSTNDYDNTEKGKVTNLTTYDLINDMFNPVIRGGSFPDLTITDKIYSGNTVLNLFKKYSNKITISNSNNIFNSNGFKIYTCMPNAGTLVLGANNALNGLSIVSAFFNEWMTFDLNGYNCTIGTAATAMAPYNVIVNNGINKSTLTYSNPINIININETFNKGINNGDIDIIIDAGMSINLNSTTVTTTGSLTINTSSEVTIASASAFNAQLSSIIFNTNSKTIDLMFSFYTDLSSKFDFSLANNGRTVKFTPQTAITFASNFGNSKNVNINYAGSNTHKIYGHNTYSGTTTISNTSSVIPLYSDSFGSGAGLVFSNNGKISNDNTDSNDLTLTKNITFNNNNYFLGSATYPNKKLTITGTHNVTGSALVLNISNSINLFIDGSVTSTIASPVTIYGSGFAYIKELVGSITGLTISWGYGACNTPKALILANLSGVKFIAYNHPTYGSITSATTCNFGGSNARVAFSWDSANSRFTKITASSTVALANVGVELSGSPTNGVYDLVVASSTMSGTLPTIQSNTTGKTCVLSQVGNTLKVTVS